MSISWRARPGNSIVRTNAVSVSQVRGRSPARSIGADEMAELFVKGEQIVHRIPPRGGHVRHRSMPRPRMAGPGGTGETLPDLCYDRKVLQPGEGPTMSSSVQATRLRKGMLIKVGNDLFRILELNHLTPGNKRAHIQVRMRNIRTSMLADHKFRAEEDVERAVLDEREMQFTTTATIITSGHLDLRVRSTSRRRRSASRRTTRLPTPPSASSSTT